MAAAGARAQRAKGSSCTTPLRVAKPATKSHCGNGASLWAGSRGHVVLGLCHPKVLSESLRGISPQENSLGAVHAPSCWDAPLVWHKGIYPLVFCLCQRKSACQVLPAGTGAEHVVRGTFSCCELIFFRRPDSGQTHSLPPYQRLFLSVTQVTSHMLTCGLVCRE